MTETEMRNWIDTASYQELLEKWRFEPAGSPWFTEPLGSYYANAMQARRKLEGDAAHVAASKAIGWKPK
jgi:hypothetical protein